VTGPSRLKGDDLLQLLQRLRPRLNTRYVVAERSSGAAPVAGSHPACVGPMTQAKVQGIEVSVLAWLLRSLRGEKERDTLARILRQDCRIDRRAEDIAGLLRLLDPSPVAGVVGLDLCAVQGALVGLRDGLLAENAELITAVLPTQSSDEVGPLVALGKSGTGDEKSEYGEKLQHHF